MKADQVRLAKLEGALTPKQAFLLWMEEAHKYSSMVDYARSIKGGPESAWPMVRVPEQMAQAVEQAMKGEPKEEIQRRVRQAVRDVFFLFHLHQRVNYTFLEQERYFWSQGLALSTGVNPMIRELNLASKGSGKAGNWEVVPLLNKALHWREMAEDYLGELHSLHQAFDSINQRYFDGQPGLFSGSSHPLSQLVELAENLVKVYNRDLAADLSLLDHAVGYGDCEESENQQANDLLTINGSTRGTGTIQAAYLVDMAKAEALDMTGETDRAMVLVDQYL